MGKTIIISSHILAELEQVCTDVAIMEAGRLLAAGPPREILRTLGGGRRCGCATPTAPPSATTSPTMSPRPTCCGVWWRWRAAPVVEFVEEHHGLEQLFLSLTEGVVQ